MSDPNSNIISTHTASGDADTFTGVIYAIDQRRGQLMLEADDGARMLVNPQHYQFEIYRDLMSEGTRVVAGGVRAAGLPLLMRATVARDGGD